MVDRRCDSQLTVLHNNEHTLNMPACRMQNQFQRQNKSIMIPRPRSIILSGIFVLFLVPISIGLPLDSCQKRNHTTHRLEANDLPKSDSPTNDLPLSKGSVFILLVSVALPLVTHPATGSLLSGPTSRLWLLAPTLSLAEALRIWWLILISCTRHMDLTWLPGCPVISQLEMTPCQELYCIFAARTMNDIHGQPRWRALHCWAGGNIEKPRNHNKPIGDGNERLSNAAYLVSAHMVEQSSDRRKSGTTETSRVEDDLIIAPTELDPKVDRIPQDAIEDVHQLAVKTVVDSTNATRDHPFFCCVIALLGTAQYIKIMVVSGNNTIVIRIMASLFMFHWLTLTILTILVLVTKDDTISQPMLHRIRELSKPRLIPELPEQLLYESGEAFINFEAVIFAVHLALFIGGSLLLIPTWPGSVVVVVSAVVVPWLWLLKCNQCRQQRAYKLAILGTSAVDDQSQPMEHKAVRNLLPFASTGVATDVGCIFLLIGLLYCVFVYDSAGTLRPKWPWLNWIG